MRPASCNKSGKFGTGQFIYHAEAYAKVGPFPPWKNHNEVARGADEWLGYETGYGGPRALPCGNPFGDDWLFARRISQFWKAELIRAALYIEYRRG